MYDPEHVGVGVGLEVGRKVKRRARVFIRACKFAPAPDMDDFRRLYARQRLTALGAWLKVNGEAIYDTRPMPPFRKGDWAFTRNRKTGAEYAIRLWSEAEAHCGRQALPGIEAAKVVHVGSGCEFVCEKRADGAAFDLPADFKSDANADVFKIVR